MKDITYYGLDEIRYIALGLLTEKILKGKDKISNLIELQERLIESKDRCEISDIYKEVLGSK